MERTPGRRVTGLLRAMTLGAGNPPSSDSSAPTTPDYPDVLGMITGGPRYTTELLNCAISIHPRLLAVMQSFELLVLLQNAGDKPLPVSVMLYLPHRDTGDKPLRIQAAHEIITQTVGLGETGLLRVPLVLLPPTTASENNPLGVRIEARVQRGTRAVRRLYQGRPAATLNLSPARLRALREAGFAAARHGDVLVDTFSVAEGQFVGRGSGTHGKVLVQPRYEVLWTPDELTDEWPRYERLAVEALHIANTLAARRIIEPLAELAEAGFAAIGLPLHPAEALLIARPLAYLLHDGPLAGRDAGFRRRETRWFYRLIEALSANEAVVRLESAPEFVLELLYPALIHDAVRFGLRLVSTATNQYFGGPDEQHAYADEVLHALLGRYPAEAGHIYMPLVLAGLLLAAEVRAHGEQVAATLTALRQAADQRFAFAGSQHAGLYETTLQLIARAAAILRESEQAKPS